MLPEISWGMSETNKGFCECCVFVAGSRVDGGVVERLLGSEESVCCQASRAANTIVFTGCVCGRLRELFRDLLFHLLWE